MAERLSGTERIDGEGFCFELLALSTEADLPLAELLGQPLLIELVCARTVLRAARFMVAWRRCRVLK